ncbi:MAG: hypothetical protein AAGJ19_06790 [Myxococcota bacterium]
MMKNTITHSLLAALLAVGAAACGNEDGNNDLANGNGNANTNVDMGGGNANGDVDMGNGTVDMGPDDMGNGGGVDCRIDQLDCDPGEVCNLITGECVAGKSCTRDDDCNPCDESDPAGSDDDCGHGYHVSAYCDEDHGNVCTRIRTVCETCETDADCGIFADDFFPLPSLCIEDPESDDGRRVCAIEATLGCPRGYEPRPVPGGAAGRNYCINPLGCPDREAQFICNYRDPLPDPLPEVAEENLECRERPTNPQVGQESICQDDVCAGSGNQRCAVGAFLAGLPPTCGNYCLSDAECEAANPARPFCAPSGVCNTGCRQGECAAGEVCHLDGTCGAPCEGDTIADRDSNCIDRFGNADNGDRVYCNQNRPSPPDGQPNPTPLKPYRDAGACAPLGCEVQPGEQANPDCDTNQACDETLLIPECVQGCFTEIDCQGQGNDGSVCVNASVQDITDPGGDAIVSQALCRQQQRFARDSDNRSTIGQCCNPGCITDGSCFANEFCCGEQVSREDGAAKPGSRYADPTQCANLTPISTVQARAGQCFEAPLQPWCETQCDPMNPFNTCNATVIGNLVDDPSLPYNPAVVWPQGQNNFQEDRDNINNGNAFTELQQCTVVVDGLNPMVAVTTICTTSFDRSSPDTNAPRGWQCAARSVGCLQDSDCGGAGLVCIGEDTTVDPPVNGACKCGEDGAVTVACPQQVGMADFGGRNRCVKAGPENYLTNLPANNTTGERFEEDDFACVASFTCTPPAAFFLNDEFEDVPPTFGGACQANFGGP